jgi:NAD(P)-dependent dehydrogenase (short-subunit alcohol dehydrogenase family)
MSQVGTPDIVIANAGISVGTLTAEVEDLPVFQRVFDTNVMGMVHTFQPFVPALCAAGRGRLVGVASVAGIRGLPGAGAYSASKAAAIAYLEALRVELRASGVRVVTLAPGYIATPMTAHNPYPMPFLMPVDQAARSMVRHIARGSRFAVMPWPMGIVARLLRGLPPPLFDILFSHAGRKPRQSS